MRYKLVGAIAGLTALLIVLTIIVPSVFRNHPVETEPTSADSLERVDVISDSMSTGYNASPGKGYAALLSQELVKQGRSVDIHAVNGATALRWLVCPKKPTRPDCQDPIGPASNPYAGHLDRLAAHKPTTVIITLGGNDLLINRPVDDYVGSMMALASEIRMLAPEAKIIFVRYYDVIEDETGFGIPAYPIGSTCDLAHQCDGYDTHQSWDAYWDALRVTAAEANIEIIDISDAGFTTADLSNDSLHLNDEGHERYLDALTAQLDPNPAAA